MSPTPLAVPPFTASTVLEEEREQKYNKKRHWGHIHCIPVSGPFFIPHFSGSYEIYLNILSQLALSRGLTGCTSMSESLKKSNQIKTKTDKSLNLSLMLQSNLTVCVNLAQISIQSLIWEKPNPLKLNVCYCCNEWLNLRCGCPDWVEVLDVKTSQSGTWALYDSNYHLVEIWDLNQPRNEIMSSLWAQFLTSPAV